MAILLAGTAPALLQLGSSLMAEVPLAALLAMALRSLLRATAAPTWRSAIALGATVGAALLIKWTLPLYLGPAAVAALLLAPDRRAALRLAGVAAGTALLVAGPWYARAWPLVADFVLFVGTGSSAEVFGASERTGLEEWLWYGPVLVGGLLWCPLALAAGWGAWRALRARGSDAVVLLVAILGPALLFTLLANKEIRYLLPVVPALAALGGIGLATAPRGGLLAALVGLAVVGTGPGLLTQGSAPPEVTERRWGSLRARWEQGATAPVVPVDIAVYAGGWIPLWSRRSEAFAYRRPLFDELPVAELEALVQTAGLEASREVAVLSPEAWLWTPLWARSVRARSSTRWRCAACYSSLVGRSTWFLTLDPSGSMEHCRDITEQSDREFDALRPSLRELGRWRVDERKLRLWVSEARLDGDWPPRRLRKHDD